METERREMVLRLVALRNELASCLDGRREFDGGRVIDVVRQICTTVSALIDVHSGASGFGAD